jgi:hypothetical protein
MPVQVGGKTAKYVSAFQASVLLGRVVSTIQTPDIILSSSTNNKELSTQHRAQSIIILLSNTSLSCVRSAFDVAVSGDVGRRPIQYVNKLLAEYVQDPCRGIFCKIHFVIWPF